MSPEQWVALAAAVLGLAILVWARLREADAQVQRHIDEALALIDADREAGLEANKAARWHG